MIEKAKIQYWLYASWFNIVVRYRKTILGPLWLLASPIMFISMLGLLYATISNTPIDVFVPHLSVGIIVWSLITSLMNSGTNIIVHNRPKIIHSAMGLNDLVFINLFTSLLQFAHVILIILGVWFIFKWHVTSYALVAILGVLVILINGYWYGIVFGIIGARFRDVSEIITALTGALFFITPIIWMPGNDGKGGILGPYLTYNPFYHYLELVRAPILGTPIDPLSWKVVICISIFGMFLAYVFHRKFSHQLSTWI